jgi:hypothetical protein
LNVDASEFKGSIDELSKMLQKKLHKEITIQGNKLQIDGVSASKIRDALRQSLYKLEPNAYNVISKSGSLKVKKLKPRSRRSKQKKGIPPSAPRTMPYFFPGRLS